MNEFGHRRGSNERRGEGRSRGTPVRMKDRDGELFGRVAELPSLR